MSRQSGGGPVAHGRGDPGVFRALDAGEEVFLERVPLLPGHLVQKVTLDR